MIDRVHGQELARRLSYQKYKSQLFRHRLQVLRLFQQPAMSALFIFPLNGKDFNAFH